ncbi:MAG: twin-arginine translocation signal domain-containing protein, partial [Burkholderiaceae bacterium]|nr:twin-arginine translocation signal domain-containing protein [Burkholderiaceae bacterium]
MTRRSFIKQTGGLAIAGGATLLSSSALAQSDTVRWRCASSFPKSVDTLYGTAEL